MADKMDEHMDDQASKTAAGVAEGSPEHAAQIVPDQLAEAMDEDESPPLTHALEALLGGLDPPKPVEDVATSTDSAVHQETLSKVAMTSPPAGEASQPNVDQELHPPSAIPTEVKDELSRRVAHQSVAETDEGNAGPREWETDSSPYESSSDDSSDDSSDEDSEDEEGENSYKLLSPEEQARILMEGDGGSDDEGPGKSKGAGGQVRTKNEVSETIIPKPDIIITEDMPIEELGAVEGIVDNILLIKAKTTGEFRVLESGSVLCLADRSVFGAVAETLGRVQQPLYSVMFTNATEIADAKLEVGTKVYYSEKHSTYVFTQALKAFKGSDASNLHDEEVGDDEMEFSDDEAEAEHKRRVKQAKRGRGGKSQQNGGSGRGNHPLQQQHTATDLSKGLMYDEEDDGPYKPLPRPVGYADSVGRNEPPQEEAYQSGPIVNHNREHFRGRGRGRGDRGRGERGRGRGGFQDRLPGSSGGYTQPPQGRPNYPQNLPPRPSFQPQANSFPQPPSANYNPEYSSHQPQLPNWPQFPSSAPFQQFHPNMQGMQNMWPNMAAPPGGAFINPAFFASQQVAPPNQWNNQSNQRGRGGGRGD